MRLLRTTHFERSYSKAPKEIQQAFDKQSLLLLQNLRHPSLHAKKYDEGKNRWQARVTRGWRFYFTIDDDAYTLLDITSHPK
jgi:mRNA-degrading endonuclease RelE of RelBE toxin-antitoxin system